MVFRRLVFRLTVTVVGGSAGNESGAGDKYSFGRADRSQSEVLGTVLLFGLSMFVIGTSLTLGGAAVTDLLSDAESDNVENGMSHLSSKVSLVALGDADTQRFRLGAMREGTLVVRPDAGTITISNVTNDSREVLNDDRTQLGAIVYEGGDREIAYQGGGIWTKDGNTSRLVSPPEYHYRGTTLTLPIINVTGEGAVGGRPSGRITPGDVATDAVPNVSTPLETGVIEVKIQSEYYQGWYEFLSERTEGETEIYHANETVVSKLTVPDIVTFDTSLSVQTTYDANGNSDIGSVEDNVPHRSARPLIEQQITDAEASGTGNGCLGGGYCELDAGTYLYDGNLTLDDDLDLNTTDGNITLIVDGTFDIENNEVTVVDNSTPEHGVEYYVADSLRAQGNSFVGTDDPDVPDDRDATEAERNVFYVGEEFLDDSTGGGTIVFDAIIYAPDADVDSNGNAEITGSLVANSLSISGNFAIYHDSSLEQTSIEVTGAADLLRYLHVSHNEVRVELS